MEGVVWMSLIRSRLGKVTFRPTRSRDSLLAEADVILLAGERVDDRMEFGAPGSVNPDAKVIQMWPKAEDIGINRQVDIGLVSDTRAGLEDLLSAYGKNGTSRDEWVARLRTEKEAELAAFDGILANPPNRYTRLCWSMRSNVIWKKRGNPTRWRAVRPISNPGPAGCSSPRGWGNLLAVDTPVRWVRAFPMRWV